VLIEMRATDNKTRENIVWAMQRKEKRYNISLWLNVSLSTIDKVWRKFRETGIYLPIPYTGHKSTLTSEQNQQIRAKIAETPDITLNELREELSLDLSESGLSLHLKATSGNSRFTFQTDKNKINVAVAPYKLPYFTLTAHYTLLVKRFSEAVLKRWVYLLKKRHFMQTDKNDLMSSKNASNSAKYKKP
jgi:transposase